MLISKWSALGPIHQPRCRKNERKVTGALVHTVTVVDIVIFCPNTKVHSGVRFLSFSLFVWKKDPSIREAFYTTKYHLPDKTRRAKTLVGMHLSKLPHLTSINFINHFVFRRQLRRLLFKVKKAAILEKDGHQTFWSFLFCLGFRRSKRCFLISRRLFSISVLSAATAAWRRRDDRINTYTLNFSMKNDPCGISNDYLASLKLELPSAVWTAEPCLDYVFSQDPTRMNGG